MLNLAISNREPVSMAFLTRLPLRPTQLDANNTGYTDVPISPILCLPSHLRRRIYLHTDLLVRYDREDTHAVLNLNGGTPVPSFCCRLTYKKHGLNGIHGFHGLLLSCRTIYKEASALIYSHNRFIIRYWEKGSLAPLRNLTPYSLSKLTYLKIVLNQASCHHKSPTAWHEDSMDVCHDSRRRDDEGGTDQAFDPVLCNAPLEIGQPRAKILLAEWHSTVAYMSSHISPKSLELSVVCDVQHDDMEAARHAIDPISLFPELRNCHIRLCRTSTPQLRRMAHDAVLEARRITIPPSSGNILGVARSTQLENTRHPQLRGESRLLALPRELRFHILTYTDLVTPWRQVEWSRYQRDSGHYVALKYECGLSQGDRMHCDPELHHGCRFVDCWAAGCVWRSKFSIGCFCSLRHSTSSTTCTCWAPPTALFLVSSQEHLYVRPC